MPFKKLSDLPANIQKLPVKAQQVFQSSFNSAFPKFKGKKDQEQKAFAVANAAVKKAGFQFAEPTTEWMALMKTGTHTASSGKEVTITESDLDNMVQKYSESDHEAPIVIGHPKMDSPAWGWIGELKREGEMLFGRPAKMVSEFVEWAKKGLYKKRSISLYPDMTLKHVGFLGGTPPAVKGLPDFCFKEDKGESITFEFGEKHFVVKDILSRMRDWFIEKEGVEQANKIIPNFDLEFLGMPEREESPDQPTNLFTEFPNKPKTKEKNKMSFGAWFKKKVEETPDEELNFMDLAQPKKQEEKKPTGVTFSEADMEAEKKKAIEEGKEVARLEFAEKEEKLRKEQVTASIVKFCEKKEIIPAWKKAGIQEYMESLLEDSTQLEFAEKEPKSTKLAWFMKFVDGLKVITFSEVAKGIPPADVDANTKLVQLAEKEIDKNSELSFSEAMTKVNYMYPDLANAAADEQEVNIIN